jgi:putative ATP-dependent endonuclease of OLD family
MYRTTACHYARKELMKVVRLTIANFRAIKRAEIHFEGHTLLVGMNNVGKSTVCEALELALGRDRLRRFPPVEEFDFYNSRYLDRSVDPAVPVAIEIEVVLADLHQELANKCFDHLERWHRTEKRVLAEGEIDLADNANVCECLRIKTIANYDLEEDEFEAKSVFCNGAMQPDGNPLEVPRSIRPLFGFFYLRALRTGARALSLERGSLLDIILQRRKIRTGIWENAIEQLRNLEPPIDEGAADLAPVLENIEKRLAQYIPLTGEGRATQLFVSQLRREHLRKTIAFFLRTSNDQVPVPFQEAGTGTLNTLVLALLSFLADIRKDNIIFAMEEPEIALPPHTQRRIANYLLSGATQCFVTSHSPYIIERFQPEQVQVLRKDEEATLTATKLTIGTTLKGKTYRKHARRGLAEAMLGRGVIVCEGVTEKDIILAAAEKMEEANPEDCYPIDLSGVSVISVDGDGALAEFGSFFKALQITTYAFYDQKDRTPAEQQRLADSFHHPNETGYAGSEDMLVEEVPPHRLWDLLEELRDSGQKPHLPQVMPAMADLKTLARSVLKKDKGSGYAGLLIELCEPHELPPTVTEFLNIVYANFKRPDPVPPIDPPEATESVVQIDTEPVGASVENSEAV